MTDSESDSKLSSNKLIFCNRCKAETNHICQAEHLSELRYELEWEDRWYRIWVCAGCEHATFEVCTTNSGMKNEDGSFDYQSEYYPRRAEYDIESKRFIQLPKKLDNIYREAIQAFNDDLRVLCAAGLRALIEGICDDKGVHGTSLESKITALGGILPENIVRNLHSFRFIGNNALHELAPPTKEALRLAIEISEDLLNFLYELDYKASRLTTYRETGSIYPSPPRIPKKQT